MQAKTDNLFTFNSFKPIPMLRFLSVLLLVGLSTGVFAQGRMSSTEIGFSYNLDHEFLLSERVARQGNLYKVYIRFRLNSGNVKIGDYELSYDLRSSYIDEKKINSSVLLEESNVIDNGFREFTFAIEFEKSDDDNLLVLQVENIVRNRKYQKDIPLSSANGIDHNPFLLFDAEKDIPFFENYINTKGTIRVKNVFGNSGSFSIKGLENNMQVAMPPFDDSDREGPDEISLDDTVYGILEGEAFTFPTPGFYEISAAEDENSVTSLLVTDAFYPYFEEYTELVKPLIYISTNQEFTSMLGSDNPKVSFENFVLETISSNTNIAKDFVKYYYRRVRKSAQLFTDQTEGWKTDRGMVYQVYGNPATVFRNETTELWVYVSENGGRTRFIFDIVEGPAGTRQYKLIRGKRFRDGWMNAVSRWRSGRIIE